MSSPLYVSAGQVALTDYPLSSYKDDETIMTTEKLLLAIAISQKRIADQLETITGELSPSACPNDGSLHDRVFEIMQRVK